MKFETASAKDRFEWAMRLVHVPSEGLSAERFFAQAGVLAGIDPSAAVNVAIEFYRRHGRNARILRAELSDKNRNSI